MNDWIALGLAFGVLCGGLALGRSVGTVAAWWLAGGAWLAFRLADRVWRPVVIELRASTPDLDVVTWVPLAYGMIFAAMFIPTVVWLLIVQPKDDVPLPGKADAILGVTGGGLAGLVLVLAAVQAHVLHPLARERMPATMELAASALGALGQNYVRFPVAGEKPADGGAPAAGGTGAGAAAKPGAAGGK